LVPKTKPIRHVRRKAKGTVAGIIVLEESTVLSIVTPNETLRIARDEIERITPSQISMMPEGLLTGMNDDEIRDLVAYLRLPAQADMLSTRSRQ